MASFILVLWTYFIAAAVLRFKWLKFFSRFYFSNENMKAKNYDGRTALHLAASEGHLSCVKFLVETCNLDPLAKDRYPHFFILDYERLEFYV